MNQPIPSSNTMKQMTVPVIKGIAYVIISSEGAVFYSSPQSEKTFHLREGDHVVWLTDVESHPGHLLVKNPQSGLNEKPILISNVFDLVWHGAQAKMLMLDTQSQHHNQKSDRAFTSQGKNSPSITPWTSFQCKYDKGLALTSIDKQCLALTGYPDSEMTGNKKNYRNLIAEIDRQTIFQIVKNAVNTHQPYSVIYRIKLANGGDKWIEEHGQAVEKEIAKNKSIQGWLVDVTDRKNIEDALWESESRYRSLVEASPDAVLMLSKNGTILFANNQFCNLVGATDPDSLQGKYILDFLILDKAITSEISFPSLWESLPARGSIFTLRDANGVEIPVETSISIIRNNSGEINAYIAIGRDIRERKRTEQAFRESEARYRAIVENNPEMVIRFNGEGKVTFANTAFLNYVGLTLDELFSQKLPAKTKIKHNYLMKQLLNHISPEMEPLENEFYVQISPEEVHWYRWRTIAIQDESGKFLEYQSIGEDITDKKRAQQVEKESENHLAQLMENIKLLSIVLNLNGQVVSCNSYFSEVTGWKKEEVLNQDWFSRFIPTDLASSLKHDLIDLAMLDQLPVRYENPIITRSGERRLIAWTNTVMKDSYGVPQAIASVGEDITEKEAMERIDEAIVEISLATNEVDNLNYLYRSIHEILKKLAPVENLFIALYDKKKDLISFPYFVDQFDPPPPPKTPGNGLTEYVLRTGKSLAINPEKFSALVDNEGIESIGAPSLDWIGVPLKVENEIIGVMGAQTYSPGIRYGKKDEQILTFVSTQIAHAINRKQREQDLLASQKRNQLLIEASTDAIFMESLDGAIIDCNEVALQLYGYSREEMLKLNVKDLVGPQSTDNIHEFLEWELNQGSTLFDVVNVRKDGTIFPVAVSIRQTTTTDLPVLVAYIRDITEQKKAERDLIENEGKFRTLSESTTAGIFIYRDDKYLYVNPMWCQITGFPEDELLLMKPLDIMNTEVNLDGASHIEQGKDGDIGRARVEHTLVTHDGETKTIDLMITQILFEGQPAVIGTAIDITNRKQREHELEVIAEMGETLRININTDQVLSTAMTKLMAIMKLDGVFFSLVNKQTQLIEITKASGVWKDLGTVKMRRDQGLSGHIISTGRAYLNTRPENDPYILYPEYSKGFSGIAGVPLMAKGEIIGSLVIGSKQHFSENDLRLLKAIGDLTSSAIHRADLFEQNAQQTEELRHAYDSTLEGWALALELRDKETQGHSVRIAKMTMRLAKRLNIPEEQMENIRRGALLHDIGKLAVPDTILLKNGPLTSEEWVIMQKHPTYAYEMLSQIKFFKGAIDIPYCHHEWWDGSGYPRGLEGKNIPLASRIFCIVDVWDALTSNRPYREAWKKDEALAHIINQAGTHFDPDIVNEFIQMIVEEK